MQKFYNSHLLSLNSKKLVGQKTILSHFPTRKSVRLYGAKYPQFRKKIRLKHKFKERKIDENVFSYWTYWLFDKKVRIAFEGHTPINKDIFVNFPLFKSMFRSIFIAKFQFFFTKIQIFHRRKMTWKLRFISTNFRIQGEEIRIFKTFAFWSILAYILLQFFFLYVLNWNSNHIKWGADWLCYLAKQSFNRWLKVWTVQIVLLYDAKFFFTNRL